MEDVTDTRFSIDDTAVVETTNGPVRGAGDGVLQADLQRRAHVLPALGSGRPPAAPAEHAEDLVQIDALEVGSSARPAFAAEAEAAGSALTERAAAGASAAEAAELFVALGVAAARPQRR